MARAKLALAVLARLKPCGEIDLAAVAPMLNEVVLRLKTSDVALGAQVEAVGLAASCRIRTRMRMATSMSLTVNP